MKLKYVKREENEKGGQEIEWEVDDEEARVIAKEIIAQLASMLYMEVGRSLVGLFKKAIFIVLFIIVFALFVAELRLTDWLKDSFGLGLLGKVAIIRPSDMKKIYKPNNTDSE